LEIDNQPSTSVSFCRIWKTTPGRNIFLRNANRDCIVFLVALATLSSLSRAPRATPLGAPEGTRVQSITHAQQNMHQSQVLAIYAFPASLLFFTWLFLFGWMAAADTLLPITAIGMLIWTYFEFAKVQKRKAAAGKKQKALGSCSSAKGKCPWTLLYFLLSMYSVI